MGMPESKVGRSARRCAPPPDGGGGGGTLALVGTLGKSRLAPVTVSVVPRGCLCTVPNNGDAWVQGGEEG